MRKRIVWRNAEGDICVTTPAPKADVARSVPEVANMSEAQYIDWVRRKDLPPSATDVKVVDVSEVPPRGPNGKRGPRNV